MAFAVDFFPSTGRTVTGRSGRAKSVLVPRLMSGAALVGGSFAAGLWVAVTFSTLHGVGFSQASVSSPFSRDMAAEFRNSLVLPKPPVAAVRRDEVRSAQVVKEKMAQVRHEIAALSTPVSRPLDLAGRAILEQALAVSIAERALAQRWSNDTGSQVAEAVAAKPQPVQATAMPPQQVAEAILKTAPPLGQINQPLSAQLQPVATALVADRGRDPVAPPQAGPVTIASAEPPAAAKPMQVAMLPDVVPAPINRPKSDPFREVLVAPKPETDANTDTSARPQPKTIPLKSAPEKTAPKTVMAYARSQEVMDDDESPSIFRKRASLPGRGSGVAVYDISSATVYMPNGEKLVAHSGRGENRDNPRSVHIKNRGATPPNIYRLTLRESLFHGVEALRMTPVGGNNMYGRDGFLTHTFLLRVRGDSSGCVVFQEYPRFLAAYKRGDIKTLIVVPTAAELPKYMAKL
ncbi:tlde1 domain-containing protein [Agrobacterium vitis]